MDYCLMVDYDGEGLSLPNFAWPRLRETVKNNPELPWDILLVRSSPLFFVLFCGPNACLDLRFWPLSCNAGILLTSQ